MTFVTGFAQEYREKSHDIVICSLVLVHNVTSESFKNLIKKICKCGQVIFVFEDITQGRTTGPFTKIRGEKEIIREFNTNGYEVVQRGAYRLVLDDILYLQLSKTARD